jgi:hypothetical protein
VKFGSHDDYQQQNVQAKMICESGLLYKPENKMDLHWGFETGFSFISLMEIGSPSGHCGMISLGIPREAAELIQFAKKKRNKRKEKQGSTIK